MFDGCIDWLQQQEEASLYNISILNKLRELAAKKRLSSLNSLHWQTSFQLPIHQTRDFLIVNNFYTIINHIACDTFTIIYTINI